MGMTIITIRPCEYCAGDGTVAYRDRKSKRLKVQPCPVCLGDPAGAPTIQGDVLKLIRRAK